MSQTDTYYRYHDERVLLTFSQISRPTASPAWVYLTGAQVEMLRNMTQYLNRPNTYVWEYEVDKYLTPNADNFDVIQAIVANLEEKLMGNLNTLWGYDDRLAVLINHTKVGGVTYNMDMFTVPAGYVYVVNAIMSYNVNTAVTQRHKLHDGTSFYIVRSVDAQPAYTWLLTDNVNYPLKEGDKVTLSWVNCLDGDTLYGRVWGYKMVVP